MIRKTSTLSGNFYYTVKPLSRVVYAAYQKGYFVARMLGWQLYVKNIGRYPLLLSERTGKSKYFRLGKYVITLKKIK